MKMFSSEKSNYYMTLTFLAQPEYKMIIQIKCLTENRQ